MSYLGVWSNAGKMMVRRDRGDESLSCENGVYIGFREADKSCHGSRGSELDMGSCDRVWCPELHRNEQDNGRIRVSTQTTKAWSRPFAHCIDSRRQNPLPRASNWTHISYLQDDYCEVYPLLERKWCSKTGLLPCNRGAHMSPSGEMETDRP